MIELINSKQVEDYASPHAICQNKSPGHTHLAVVDGGVLPTSPLAGKPLPIIISVPVIPVGGILKVYWAMGHLCHIMQYAHNTGIDPHCHKSCLTLLQPQYCSTPGFRCPTIPRSSVQTQVHWVWKQANLCPWKWWKVLQEVWTLSGIPR